MLHPAEDLEDRRPIWDYMQNFWMDTDPDILLSEVARICAESKYTLSELEEIYWNEVRPAVSFNLLMLPAPEWAGLEIEWLTQRILKTHRFGRCVRLPWLRPYAQAWWRKLQSGVLAIRERSAIT
jgi:hypothetical protein